MTRTITFIHTADLHQGFNFSLAKWKKGIKQRSDDFLNNFLSIIKRSLDSDVDFLVIAGDIFDRSKPPPVIRQIIIENLVKVSSLKPVILIPGNHDKSKFSQGLLFIHKNLKIFNTAKSDYVTINNIKISITAIPFVKKDKLRTIKNILEQSCSIQSDFKLLLMHELVESCKVGIQNFEFTKYMKSVIPTDIIDHKYDYIALGHVHKFQQIQKSKNPMYYSGSIERTSIVERDEQKGYLLVKASIKDNGSLTIIPSFIPLPARTMNYFKIQSLSTLDLERFISKIQIEVQNINFQPLLVIKIINLDDYEKYKQIKSYLNKLKDKSKIFDYALTNPLITNNKGK